MRRKDKQITDKKRKLDENTGVIFSIFRHVCLGEDQPKNQPKKYNIDYFGQAVNLEFKYKLNFDQGGVLKIEKK